MNDKKKNQYLSLVNKNEINKSEQDVNILIVNANYYKDISKKLLNGACKYLKERNVNYKNGFFTKERNTSSSPLPQRAQIDNLFS